MTPKEKANQLVDRFMDLSEEQEYNTPRYMSKEMAKQSALILVDEMIANAGYIWGGHETETGLSARDSFRKYWHNVSSELEEMQ